MGREIGDKNCATFEDGLQKNNTRKLKRLIQRIFKRISLEKFSRMCCLPLSRFATSIFGRDCPELNDNMVEKILGRLPMPSLLRVKTVCKAWNTAISSPNFIAEDNIHHYFVMQVDLENIALFSSALNRWFQIALPRCRDGFDRRMCAAEAAGLYLFVEWNTNLQYYSMIIVNPVTKQQRSLPPLPNEWNQVAVELVAQSDHIEIIAFGFHNRESYLCALIYTSFTNEWRNVQLTDAIPFLNGSGRRHCGTSALHNGIVYIATFSGTHLAWYDIKSQEFQFRQIARSFQNGYFHYYSMPTLVSCGGKLLLVVPMSAPGIMPGWVEIWELDKDNDDNTCSCSLLSVTPEDLIQRSWDTFYFMVGAASDKIWLTITECKHLINFDMRSMKWNNVLPGCPAECEPDMFPIPRRALCGTLSIHNKLHLFD